MPYTPNPIHFRADLSGHGVVLERDGTLFTGAVDTYLMSFWEYYANACQFFVGDGNGGFSFWPNHRAGPGSDFVVSASKAGSSILDVDYALPSSLACATHFLVSVQLSTSTIQFYLNDALITGSVTWTTPGPVTLAGSTTVTSWGDTSAPFITNCQGYGSDFWFGTTSGFVDLTVVANRRKFINADLTPVDLGANGQNPFGTSPQVFQNVLTGGVASDWLINRGSAGGTFILDQSTITLDGNPCGSVAPPSETLTDAELVFSDTPGFVDFTNAANRRLFIAAGGTPQWLGSNGALPFGGTIPPVYLTLPSTMAAANQFAQNNGNGGALVVSGSIANASTAPGCTDYYTQEAAGPEANPEWRLTVSDDGGRVWSTLVKPREIGQTGQYRTRLRWLKMGQFRQRIVKLECSDPVRRNIIGFYADLTPGMG